VLPGARMGPAGQSEEGGLEYVLGVMTVVEDPFCGVEDHGAVATHQGGKGGLILLPGEPPKQLPVREGVTTLLGDELTDMSQDGVGCITGHDGLPREELVLNDSLHGKASPGENGTDNLASFCGRPPHGRVSH